MCALKLLYTTLAKVLASKRGRAQAPKILACGRGGGSCSGAYVDVFVFFLLR